MKLRTMTEHRGQEHGVVWTAQFRWVGVPEGWREAWWPSLGRLDCTRPARGVQGPPAGLSRCSLQTTPHGSSAGLDGELQAAPTNSRRLSRRASLRPRGTGVLDAGPWSASCLASVGSDWTLFRLSTHAHAHTEKAWEWPNRWGMWGHPLTCQGQGRPLKMNWTPRTVLSRLFNDLIGMQQRSPRSQRKSPLDLQQRGCGWES